MACKDCKCNDTQKKSVEEIIKEIKPEPSEIIHCLQLIQKEFGFISTDAIRAISKYLSVPESDIYSVVTFYSQFSLKQRAKYNIEVCMGTACYVLGAEKTLQKFEKLLNIDLGEQTEDAKYELLQSRCLGCCGLAPVVSVNGEVHGKITGE